mmetsp:Transcript_51572/g.115824  ORF Transcript_51572/g.115824 Transcript_51572/m.115824 type:complete len:236 (+) Transcript_51572:477-1184(+)
MACHVISLAASGLAPAPMHASPPTDCRICSPADTATPFVWPTPSIATWQSDLQHFPSISTRAPTERKTSEPEPYQPPQHAASSLCLGIGGRRAAVSGSLRIPHTPQFSASDSAGDGSGVGISSYSSSMLSGSTHSGTKRLYFWQSSWTKRGPLVAESWVADTFVRGISPNWAFVRAPGASSSASSAAAEEDPAPGDPAPEDSWNRILVCVSLAGSSRECMVEFGSPGRNSDLSFT